MKLKEYIIGLILFAMCFVIVPNAYANSHSFVKKQFNSLEKEIRDAYSIKEIAQKLSNLKTYSQWPETVTTNYKLYIGINWFNQQHVTEASDLLGKLKVEQKYYHLWAYYQSMLAMLSARTDLAAKYMSEIEQEHKKDVDYLLLKSIYLSQTDDLLGAIALMDKVIKKNRRYGDAYLQRGFFYLLALSHDLAIKDFAKALKYLPEHEINKRQQALFQNGLLYLRYKFDQKKGMALIKEGVALDPNSVLVKQVMQAMQQ